MRDNNDVESCNNTQRTSHCSRARQRRKKPHLDGHCSYRRIMFLACADVVCNTGDVQFFLKEKTAEEVKLEK